MNAKDLLRYGQLNTKPVGELTLAEHAEMWFFETYGHLPAHDTQAWDKMYQQWVEFAFNRDKGAK